MTGTVEERADAAGVRQQWHERTLATWSQQTGVAVDDAQLLRVGHAAAYALPSADAFLRVHKHGDDPRGDIAFAIAAGNRFLQPTKIGANSSVWCAADGTAVTTWPLAQQQPGDSEFDWRALGETLAALTERPTGNIRPLPDGRRLTTQRLQTYQTMRDHDPTIATTIAKRLSALSSFHRQTLATGQLVHGDAHPGNTVILNGRPTVCDYDLAGVGDPIENTIGVSVMWLHYGIGDKAFEAFIRGWGNDPREAADFRVRTELRALLYASSCFGLGAPGATELKARVASLDAPGTHIWRAARVPPA